MSPAHGSCVFCGIVDDPKQAEVVWEDDWVLGFMDINPVTDGHVLVVPKVHVCSFTDVPHATAARMMNVAQWIAAALKTSGLRCEGVNLMSRAVRRRFRRSSTPTSTLFRGSLVTDSRSMPPGSDDREARWRHPRTPFAELCGTERLRWDAWELCAQRR